MWLETLLVSYSTCVQQLGSLFALESANQETGVKKFKILFQKETNNLRPREILIFMTLGNLVCCVINKCELSSFLQLLNIDLDRWSKLDFSICQHE